jgi:hypothetical protein
MRSFFTLLLILLSLTGYSQVSMEKVLIETGTATWNNACANEVEIIEELKSQGLDIAIINYHLNDPFANQYSNNRASYYNIQSVPYPIVQGEPIIPGDLENYLNAIELAAEQTSAFVISAQGSFLEDTLYLEVEVNKVSDYESDEIRLHVALIESNIAYEWLQLEEVNEVERSMAPNAGGSALDFSASSSQTIGLEVTMEENWNPAAMMLVAFVQNDTSKQVLQCHSVALTEFSPLPVHAFFQVEDTLICRKDLIAFENYSTGDVESIHWYFEGGLPETSTEQQPQIRYLETGVFDVRLVVNNSISLDTTFIEDYIHVRELPEIGFSPLSDFCHDDPPYQLKEGWPEEGNYFGLFVDSGYFHPEVAGPGNYLVYFAYQDEETMCSDTLSQTAFVQLCNSIKEFEQTLPLKYSWSGDQLIIEMKQDFSNSNARILIYSPIGQLLGQLDLSSNNKFQWVCPPHQRCFILALENNSELVSLKICR